MAARVIVSYDGTANDRDALVLGAMFKEAGANVSLAYVRHFPETERANEEAYERDARELLERGAQWLGDLETACHVVLSASTSEGLRALAEREAADVIVFGSDYRTAAGNVQPNTSAQRLLGGGPAAVALAPAGLRDRGPLAVEKIGVLQGNGDPSASRTATALAGRLGATISDVGGRPIDLLVVGSRPEAPVGRVLLSATAEYAIENARCPVLVVPHGVAVELGDELLAAI